MDGTIDLEKMENVLYVGRPAFGQEQSTVGMFRLEPDGSNAVRAQVKLGRSSVNTVEILQGLKEGDQVILSDMSRWDILRSRSSGIELSAEKRKELRWLTRER